MTDNQPNTALFALHGINGERNAVSFLSPSLSIVLVALNPVTVHPHDKINGINDFPLKPKRQKIPSKTNATRAI